MSGQDWFEHETWDMQVSGGSRVSLPATTTEDATTGDGELQALIASVGARAVAVRTAAARAERAARLADETDDRGSYTRRHLISASDEQEVRAWLHDVARIAALVCDQPNPVSKELGARLEMIVTDMTASATDV